MLFGTSGFLDLGIVTLLAIALSEHFKWRAKADKGFSWLALSGIFFIFVGTFPEVTVFNQFVSSGWTTTQNFFEALAWIFALIGTIFIGYETLIEK